MLKDITIGQFFPGKSIIHRMDPRMKLVLVIAFIVFIFVAQNPVSLGFTVMATLSVVLLSRVPVRMYVRSLKPIIPIILLTTVLNMLYMEGGDSLFKWWILNITTKGLEIAVFMSVRIITLITVSSLLTYTTSPTALTDAIERLLSPLKKLRLDVHSLAMMMTIALRFVPTLIEETDKIMSAQKARGADIESGGLLRRVKALIPILIPLFVSSFRRAYDLAYAMECRCYNGGEGRTRMKILRLGLIDYVSLTAATAICAATIGLNYWVF